MDAKCPVCFGEKEECEKCDGTGNVTITIAKGKLYTIACMDKECGMTNGGRIVGPKIPPLPPTPDIPCLDCRGPSYWKYLGEIE